MMKMFVKKNIVIIVVLFVFMVMTVGYALYGQTLHLNGNVTLQEAGIIEITSANIVRNECSNITSYEEPNYKGMHIDFRVNSTSKEFVATYLVTVTNNSDRAYTYTGFPINAVIEGTESSPTVSSQITKADTGEELMSGEVIESGNSITIKLRLSFSLQEADPRGLTVIVNGDVSVSEDNSGSLVASITPNTGDLRGEGTIVPFQLSVINTFKYNRVFSLNSSNENIIIVDEKGNISYNFVIEANSTKDYTIYLMVKEGSIFLTDQTQTNIILSSNMIDSITVETLTLDVDKDINATDHEKPEVGSVTLRISETNPVEGEAIVSWNRIDSGGSPISNYFIQLYNEASGNYTTYETGNDITSYTIQGLSAGTYYAKVYGIDEAGNSGEEDCSSATTENGYCSRSASTSLQWIYNVDYSNLTNLTFSGANSAMIYSTYQGTLNVESTWYNPHSLPSSITVTMGGVTLTSGQDYTYDASSGAVVINRVTGDITISATASDGGCLIEGTKVRLANGSYKNIEDINYDDLLMVYDHENGRITYEYPVWVEQGKKTVYYQKTTFSDGTILKTFTSHGVFSPDVNRFVMTNDPSEFHVGTRVVKFDEKGNKKIVTVSNIEMIHEETMYYQVSSVRYHNILANDFLTTDGTRITSYLFSFNEDMTWGKDREEFLQKNDLFHYEDWKDYFPEHLFKGYRMEEAKNVFNQGLLDIGYFDQLLDLSNSKPLLKDESGHTVWMVTTSDDQVTEDNKHQYLVRANNYYTLKEPKNKQGFIGWLNTADNKIYQVNDRVEVVYGMHFIAQYQ